MTFAPRSVLALALSLAAAAASFSVSSSAQAADSCKANADCGAGFYCELQAPPSVSCGSSDGKPADCPEPTPAPAVEGFCREKPLDCKADGDCPAYLACVSTGGGDVTCSAPACAPGEECPEPVCEEPKVDPNAPMICAPKMIDCTSDAGCPDGFACNIELGAACPTIACDPSDSNCKQPECDTSTKKICGPKEIDCKADGDCPADWRCISFEEGSCSGSGGGEVPPGGGGEPVPAPMPGSKFADESGCSVTVRNLCAPKGYLAGVEQSGSFDKAQGSPLAEAGGTNNSGSKAPSYSSPTRGSDTQPSSGGAASDDGCSTSGSRPGTGLLGVLLVGLAARLARRRAR